MKDKRKCKKPIHVSFDAGYGSPSAQTNFKSWYCSGLPLIRKLQIPWLFLDFSLTFKQFSLTYYKWETINVYIHFSFFCRPPIFFSAFSDSFLFSWKEGEGIERKHSQQKPLTTTTTCVRRRVSNWLLCLLCSILFIFSERKCILKSWRKLMNYKPEKRIPWLFTDFDFQDITGLLFLQCGVVRCFCWGHVNCSSPANAQSLSFPSLLQFASILLHSLCSLPIPS